MRICVELAERHGLTQREISGLLSLTQAAVSKYLNGKYSPGLKEVGNEIDNGTVADLASDILNGRKNDFERRVCGVCYGKFHSKCRIRVI